MSALAVEELRTLDHLERIAPDWSVLFERCTTATPFQSPFWLIPWWQHFHPGTLFSVAVRRGKQLIGLAPFYLENSALGRRLLPLGISVSDYLDMLLDPEFASEAGAAIIAHYAARGAEWDVWEMEELAPSAAARRLAVPDGWSEATTAQSACPFLALPDGAMLANVLPRKKRRAHDLARNRAARRGEVAFSRAAAEDASVAFERLIALHTASWNERGQPGLLADTTMRAFLREAVPRMAEAGLLVQYELRIGDALAAALIGFRHRGSASAYMIGFDPAFSFESPGLLLIAHAIEQAMTDGAHEFDFLRGQEPHKYGWGATDRWNSKRSLRHG